MTLEQHQKTVEGATGKPSTTHVDSTSDERTTNNVVRHEYRVLTDAEKDQMKQIKDMGLRFIEFCDAIRVVTIGSTDTDHSNAKPVNTRELSLAKTKMEEAVMWAVKHITR